MDSIVLTRGHGERPGLPGKRSSDTRERSISPKRIKPTIDPSSIEYERPNMMLHKDAVLVRLVLSFGRLVYPIQSLVIIMNMKMGRWHSLQITVISLCCVMV